MARLWRIRVGDDVTQAGLDDVAGSNDVFICAHGAGGNRTDRNTTALAKAIASRGLRVVRFDFLYAAKGSARPDRMPRLIECYDAVITRVKKELAPARVFLGGRSMGGRASTMMAADAYPCDALLLYAYPLHPPGAPDKLRDEHLPKIRVPVLCFNGTRDDFCTPALMKKALVPVQKNTHWQQEWIDDADHSFHVRKRSGTNDAAVLAAVAETTLAFVRSLDMR